MRGGGRGSAVPFWTGGRVDGEAGEGVGSGSSVGPGGNMENRETTGGPHRYHGNGPPKQQQQEVVRTASARATSQHANVTRCGTQLNVRSSAGRSDPRSTVKDPRCLLSWPL